MHPHTQSVSTTTTAAAASAASPLSDALRRVAAMRQAAIWPNGRRYLWTDAFGVVLMVSLYEATQNEAHLDTAKWVVREVDRVLGRPKGIRIGEAPDRDGQYFHYLAMWLFALRQLGRHDGAFTQRAVQIAKDIHPHFVRHRRGVLWKMTEDLSGPYPGHEGYGALDHYKGYVIYRLVDAVALRDEINDMRQLVEQTYRSCSCSQDLGCGMLLWLSHFFPDEPWAVHIRGRMLDQLDQQWIDPPGYFAREPYLPHVCISFANSGVSIGLQAAAHLLRSQGKNDEATKITERVHKHLSYLDRFKSGDHYDQDAITHVMLACAHYPSLFLAPHPTASTVPGL